MNKSPDAIVAEKIIAELAAKQLLGETGRKKLAEQLVKGEMTSEDWRVLVEKDMPQPKEKTHAAKN